MRMAYKVHIIVHGSKTEIDCAPEELERWQEGRDMPALLDDIDRWWIAALVRLGIGEVEASQLA